MLSERSPNSSSALYHHNPAVYQLAFVHPEEEIAQKVIGREPLHSTPAGSPPSSPRREFTGVSSIPVLESEESLFDSSEEEREVPQPSEMTGAGAGPTASGMEDLFVLINGEQREHEKGLLNNIKKHWNSIKNQISYLSPNDLVSASDKAEYEDQMGQMKTLMATAVTCIDEVAEAYHQEENELAERGNLVGDRLAPRITALKDPLVLKIREYQKLLRARMAFLNNQNPPAGAGGA